MQEKLTRQSSTPPIERRVVLLLATLLVANPFVLYLLIPNGALVAAICGAAIAVVQVSAGTSRRYATAVVFNLLAIASILVHAEVLLIYRFPEKVIENLYVIRQGYYFNRPLLNQVFSSPEFSVAYRTNGQGFRIGVGQEPSLWVDKVDWLVLGDSFTQGAQVEFEQLYSTKLNVRFPDKIVLNAGISGMGIAHEYNYFVDQGRKHSPDIVILQVGSFNDFMNVEANMASLTDRLMEHSAFTRFLLHDWRYGDSAELPLGRWTEPFYPDVQGNRDYNIFYNDASPSRTRDLEAFRKYLKLLKSAVTEAGGTLLVVLLPTKEQVSDDSFNEVISSFKIAQASLDMSRPNELMAALTKELDCEFVDLLPAFKSTPGDLFFRLDEHLTPLGHSVIASAIGEFIEKRHGPPSSVLMSRDLTGDRYPSPSRDGSFVAYQSVRGGSSELFVATPDFDSAKRLTSNSIDESHPMLSSDNSRVVFTEGAAESHRTKVVIMNLDGSSRKVITDGRNEFGAIPRFSPSNLKLAYAGWGTDSSGNLTNPQIMVLDLLTGARNAITDSARESWRPVFSPDESAIVYISKTIGQFDLFSYDLKSGKETQLTTTPFDEWDPQWSPDGRRIVYAARADANWDLFLLDLPTRSVERLTATKGDEWDPAFSAKGDSLFFAGRFGSLEAVFRRSVSASNHLGGLPD